MQRTRALLQALAVVSLGGAVALGACAGTHREGQLVVAAAISLSDALAQVAAEYERTSSIEIMLNAAGSDTLATQIIAGGHADLFVSADSRQMDRLERRGLVDRGSRVDLLSNGLVAIVGRGSSIPVIGVGDLRRPSIRRIAIGDPESVPAGVYARAYLERMDAWSVIQPKLVPTRNVRAALAAVAAGHAEVGFVYRTDLRVSDEVRLAFAVPPEDALPIRYPAAVLSEARHAAEAERFLAFLKGEFACRVFTDAGFGVILGMEPS